MYLIKTIFIVFGLLGFVTFLLYKHQVWETIENKLVKLSEKLNSKLIFELAFCMQCQTFWLTVLITIVVSLFNGFYLKTILVPFVVFGMCFKLKKD